MDVQRFTQGQRVTVTRGKAQGPVPGVFEVVRLLPETGGRNHYRIRAVAGGQERVAAETELELAGR